MNLPRFSGFSLLLISLLGCSGSPPAEPNSPLVSQVSSIPGMGWIRSVTPISQLRSPSDQPSEAFLQGQVQQQIPLLNQWLYQIQDETGSIWVLTATPPPPKGQVVLIRSRIHYESILLQGKDIGEAYAEELEQLSVSDGQTSGS